jgi:methylthioribose-1-phosphate isomerase
MFSAMRYATGVLELIDQRLLPGDERWIVCADVETVAVAIETMAVRGAPAIGCAAAFGLAIDAYRFNAGTKWGDYLPRFNASVARLARTRPTAVNLFYALDRLKKLASEFRPSDPVSEASALIDRMARHLFDDDLATCQAIGRHGAGLFPRGKQLRVLTHCNTGSLATAGYGTALGVVRALHERGDVEFVYADETRPWLQGSRLTAFELKAESIPYQVIADSAAAYLMQQGKIDFAIVGADRIAANGDTANKIGTYAVAVQCRHHGLPFYVAAPRTTFDPAVATGSAIPVEERSGDEVRRIGERQMTPVDAPVYNPSFDVTPAELITGIITESGILKPPFGPAIARFLG